MANVLDAFVRFLADTKDVDAALNQRIPQAAEQAGQKSGTKFGSAVSKAITVAGAGAGLAFTAAVDGATQFEDQLRTINTVAKLTDGQLKDTGQSILDLSKETGKSTDDLTAGFYDLVSAGVPADKAIKVLKDSAVLATGALGTTAESVDLVTSAMGAYGLSADKSTRVTDIFAQAVADGKTTVADLAGGISQVAPIASAAGVSLEEVAAATAVMTLKGDTASQAMTRIKAAISALLTPNQELLDIQARTGINFAEMVKKGTPLTVVLEELRKATNGNQESFAKALGSTEALTLAFATTGDNAGAMATELGKVTDGADTGGVALGQYDEAQKSAAAGGRRLTAQIKAFLIEIGGPFVQTLGPALQTVNLLAPAFLAGGRASKIFGTIIGGVLGHGVLPLIGGLKTLGGMIKRRDLLDLPLPVLLKWDALVAKIKNSKIGGKIAEVIGTGIAKSTALGSGLAAALDAASNSAPVQKVASIAGGRFGLAFAGGIAAGIVGASVIIGDAIVRALGYDPEKQKGAAQKVGEVLGQDIVIGSQAGMAHQAQAGATKEVGKLLVKGVAQGVAEGAGSIPAALRDASPAVRAGAEVIGANIKEPIVKAALEAVRSVRASAKGIIANFNSLRSDLNAAASGAADALYDPILAANALAETQAELSAVKQKMTQKNLTKDEVKELTQRRLELGKQLILQTNDVLTYGTQAEQISKTKAFLASGFWVQAYKEATPEQKAALDDWHTALTDRLTAMENAAQGGGQDVRDGFVGELRKGGPQVKGAINSWDPAADAAFRAAQANAKKWGKNTGDAYAAGLEASYGNIHSAATYAASGAVGPMKASSPPGPESPLHHIADWGYRTFEAWAIGAQRGIDRNMRLITSSLHNVAAATTGLPLGMPDMIGHAMPAAPVTGPSGRLEGGPNHIGGRLGAGNTYIQQTKVELTGLVKAKNPFEISDTLERFQRTGVIQWPEADK